MSVRRLIVEADTTSMNVAEFCRSHGISTWFFWDLRRRYGREGDVVLAPKSRAPHHPANRTPPAVEEAIVATRKQLAEQGWDAGPDSIAARLAGLEGLPSESTIWRILTARGLIVPEPAKAPKSSLGSFTAERVNECWPLDDWTHHLADGTKVRILDALDDHSRLATVTKALWHCTGAATFEALAEAAAVLGWPQRIWSDRAKAFTEALAAALEPLGVIASHTRPHSPHSNGKIERFHLTEQRWLAQQPPAATIGELQTQLDEFRHLYNTQRPHRSLQRRTPAEVWTHAPKTGPTNRPLGTPTTISHSTIRDGRCNANGYQIALGAAHNGHTATTITTGTTAHVFINGQLTRQLTIDPTRTYQPLHNRPGRPPTITEREAPRHP